MHIGCTKNKGESSHILLNVNGIPTMVVVDTGAQTTVISIELHQSLAENNPNTLHETYLLNARVEDTIKAKCGLKVTFKSALKMIDWGVHVSTNMRISSTWV